MTWPIEFDVDWDRFEACCSGNPDLGPIQDAIEEFAKTGRGDTERADPDDPGSILLSVSTVVVKLFVDEKHRKVIAGRFYDR